MLVSFETHPATFPLIDELFGFGSESGAPFVPPLDMAEREDALVVVMELPGVSKKDLKITLEKGILSVSGERKDDQASAQKENFTRERRQGQFARSVRLPRDVDPAGVSAELTDGLLKIVLPYSENARPRQIEVK